MTHWEYPNRVNSGNAVTPIPSQATHVTAGAARGVEGVTHRLCGNNNQPTSARRGLTPLMMYAGLTGKKNRKERRIKSPRENTIGEWDLQALLRLEESGPPAFLSRKIWMQDQSGENGEHLALVQGRRDNTVRSRACSRRKAVRGAERVSTRPCGNNNRPTSARRESEEIVRAAWRHAEASHKQAGGNITDDILNITPSDVFTAAQYSWAQAAVAVSISGLEQLQNA